MIVVDDEKVKQFVDARMRSLDAEPRDKSALETVNLHTLRRIAFALESIADSLDSVAFVHGG